MLSHECAYGHGFVCVCVYVIQGLDCESIGPLRPGCVSCCGSVRLFGHEVAVSVCVCEAWECLCL